MPVPQRDLQLTRERLAEWFATQLPDAENLELSELSGPGATGFSSDTLIFDLTWTEGGRQQQRELVARVEPSGLRVFPEYDLDLQFRVLRLLGEKTEVPVPRVLWEEPRGVVLDKPFFVMERVEGRVPPDSPPYHAEGWVAEIAPEERAALWWSGVETLARIHRLDWRELGLAVVGEPPGGATPLEHHLAEIERYMEWVGEGRELSTCAAALDWLKRNRPREKEPVAFCWGDSRLGNMLFHSPEEDFAWWLFFDRHHSEGCEVPRLPGFPSREETVDRYQAWVGREVKHLDYYEIFAAFRFTLIMVRVAQQLKAYELLPADSDFEVNNTSSRLLARMLELAPPGV
jgi:aminoglycoside phosphotransferase (APT) family kinase protein